MKYAKTFDEFFRLTTGFKAHIWQADLGDTDQPANRLIRVPTGFGKTAGTVLAWFWHRVVRRQSQWPRRLVYCLPMRVLVEQTEAEVRDWLQKAECLWDGRPETRIGKTAVHVLMGGNDAGEWHLYPEESAVLIGTQDMLLSRTLNRGYASPRARWPIEFGMLNQDALWVADEVQLMDVGLATSAQLQQFREEDAAKGVYPAYTWWMSATLQPTWLESVDTAALVGGLREKMLTIPPSQRVGHLWDDVQKSSEVLDCCLAPEKVAGLALKRHAALPDGENGRITLIVCNRVERAAAVYEALLAKGRTNVDTRLIHSRFRGHERKNWREQFLRRSTCRRGADLILVATQVVEAGVDISAGCLITDLAPWPSLVQRFGRAARYGGRADVIVVPDDGSDDGAAPYNKEDLLAAREALQGLDDVSQKVLEAFEAELPEVARKRLYPYQPLHLLLWKEIDELFDTTPDLMGADLDISRFIRSGQERDCQVFWTDWEGDLPPSSLQPIRDALCAVPVYGDHGAQKWLCAGEKARTEDAFVWDYVDDRWKKLQAKRELYPGCLVLVRASMGGYNPMVGFTGAKLGKKDPAVPVVPTITPALDDQAALGDGNDALSLAGRYETIAEHGRAVEKEFARIANQLALPERILKVLLAACRLHDVGKAHPAFRAQIVPPPESGMQEVPDLAKAPAEVWKGPRKPGFRHEFASVLALLELLARVDQRHAALLGACPGWIENGLLQLESAKGAVPANVAGELRGFSAEEFNLLAYLVCAHHGKVRATWHACPADQDTVADDETGMPIRGVLEGDKMPPVRIADCTGGTETVEGLELHLASAQIGLSNRYGPSWRERTLALQAQLGLFALAWYETLLRAADIRASRSGMP
jgi:CRISPR-associated endonuclease/helicase Cas3